MKKIIFASLLLISAGAFAQGVTGILNAINGVAAGKVEPAEPMPADCSAVIREDAIIERKPDGTVTYKGIAAAITGGAANPSEGRIVRTIQGGQYNGMLCIAK